MPLLYEMDVKNPSFNFVDLANKLASFGMNGKTMS